MYTALREPSNTSLSSVRKCIILSACYLMHSHCFPDHQVEPCPKELMCGRVTAVWFKYAPSLQNELSCPKPQTLQQEFLTKVSFGASLPPDAILEFTFGFKIGVPAGISGDVDIVEVRVERGEGSPGRGRLVPCALEPDKTLISRRECSLVTRSLTSRLPFYRPILVVSTTRSLFNKKEIAFSPEKIKAFL